MRRAMRRASATSQILADYLRVTTVGGVLLLVATVAALVAANSPLADAYNRLADSTIGIEALHLKLSLRTWAADGLLAIFFFVAGLELKRELIVGELRDRRRAIVPIAAAIGGMLAPALLAAGIAAGTGLAGTAWPIPIATDIAFALAVLAITASALPVALRAFLLSLAVIDDLGSILVIAFRFTTDLALVPLFVAVAGLGGYWLLQRYRVRAAFIYVPLAFTVWALIHESGVHATIAGIAFGLLTRVNRDPKEAESPAERLEHRLQPISAGLCVPVFAFFAAGVSANADTLSELFSDRAAWAVMAGLVVGKIVGVVGFVALVVVAKIGHLGDDLNFRIITALATLSGCGFTVSLLMNELAFGGGAQAERITLAVLIASATAAVVAVVQLRLQVRRHTFTE